MAAKEVIISAGAINSPKLLMLSGVGPAEHIQKLGVTQILRYLNLDCWRFSRRPT